jgi:glycosyltransferase involved in cell wall biosynthesis
VTRLVFITQQVDPADPVLGATVPKIAALARRVDEVVVLAAAGVPDALPENCTVRRFGAPTKAQRALRFETALAAELARDPRPAAVVAHMCPIYAVLAAPLARPLRVPVLLWFTHWKASPTLQVAERLSNAVVSVDRRSFPLESAKLVAIGHGIDTTEFACADGRPAEGTLRALALGRYSPAKGLDIVLRALRIALDRGVDVSLEVRGTTPTDLERKHRRELERLAGDLGLDARVRLADPVPHGDVPALLAQADVLVNNMRAGAPDKVVYEACASCLPVLVSNPVFEALLDDLEPRLRFARDAAGELADRLETLARLGSAERRRLGRTLRARVEERHSVDTWAARVLEVARR